MFHAIQVSDGGRRLSFEAQDIDVSVMNAMRRVILSDIPNIAVFFDVNDPTNHDITVFTNTSTTHNEFLSQRLSLLPLHFRPDEIEGFDKSSLKLVIQKKNTGWDYDTVYCKDIEIIDTHTNRPIERTRRNRLLPVDPITKGSCILTKLPPNHASTAEGGELDLACFASVGTANKHTCYAVVCQATYFNTVDPALSKKKQKSSGKPQAEFDTCDKYRCFYTNEFDEPNRFTWNIESCSGWQPVEIVGKALSILGAAVRDRITSIETDDDSVKIEKVGPMFVITLQQATHTLGNLIQALWYNWYVRTNIGDADTALTYVGYNCPHPLQQTIVVKARFEKDHGEREARNVFARMLESVHDHLTGIAEKWSDAAGAQKNLP